MKDLLSKISSYNILNNLFPGGVFVFLLKCVTPFNLNEKNIAIELIMFYFIGMVISRIGSIIVEPILRKFMEYVDYSDYTKASKKDAEIRVLLETRNTYRTFAALFIVLILAKVYEFLEKVFPIIMKFRLFLIIVALLFLFIRSYIKQNKYIVNRVKETLKADIVKK